jgi:hypothetical protein
VLDAAHDKLVARLRPDELWYRIQMTVELPRPSRCRFGRG